ncbi:MAG: hypothetical protein LUQ64_02580 [Methanomicrobiales archaeon]|nr:hypothetical protein [Methanomicrobiales archaeon]
MDPLIFFIAIGAVGALLIVVSLILPPGSSPVASPPASDTPYPTMAPVTTPVTTTTTVPVTTPADPNRPAVDLYVMSYCPYGTQAETVMKPVADLLGTKADIRIRYLTSVTGSTVDSVQSLHGPFEAEEDLRQVCIQKYYPSLFWSYLSRFNSQCYPTSHTSTTASTCSHTVMSGLGILAATIDPCATGPEGIGLLRTDQVSSASKGVNASPTLFIKGVKYTGGMSPNAYKTAICKAFITPPSECSTALSGTATAATGSCG